MINQILNNAFFIWIKLLIKYLDNFLHILIIFDWIKKYKLNIYELFLWVTFFFNKIKLKNSFDIILDFLKMRILKKCRNGNGKEFVQMINSVNDADCIEQCLKRVNTHFNNVFILYTYFQYIYNLVYYCSSEILIFTKFESEYYFNNSNKFH